MRKEMQEVEASNMFKCLTCKDNQEFEHTSFIVHLKEKHNIDPGSKGKRQMVMHIDARTWYKTTYKWEIETGLDIPKTIEFMQETINPRSQDDPMRY